MAVNWGTPPPDPTPGQAGHFDHHRWLKEAVLELHGTTPTDKAPGQALPTLDPSTATVADVVAVLKRWGLCK